MDVLYTGVEPFGARAGGVDERAVTVVMVALVREKVVYESPWPNANRGAIECLFR